MNSTIALDDEITEDVKNLFWESEICIGVGAYRAAYITGYIGLLQIIKNRVLNFNEIPHNFSNNQSGFEKAIANMKVELEKVELENEQAEEAERIRKEIKQKEQVLDEKIRAEWLGIVSSLRDDNKWEEQLNNLIYQNEEKNIFSLDKFLTAEFQVLRNTRNSAAHMKKKKISYTQVMNLYEFIINYSSSIQVSGYRKYMLKKIDDHFNYLITPPNEDPVPLINEISKIQSQELFNEVLLRAFEHTFDTQIAFSVPIDNLFWVKLLECKDNLGSNFREKLKGFFNNDKYLFFSFVLCAIEPDLLTEYNYYFNPKAKSVYDFVNRRNRGEANSINTLFQMFYNEYKVFYPISYILKMYYQSEAIPNKVGLTNLTESILREVIIFKPYSEELSYSVLKMLGEVKFFEELEENILKNKVYDGIRYDVFSKWQPFIFLYLSYIKESEVRCESVKEKINRDVFERIVTTSRTYNKSAETDEDSKILKYIKEKKLDKLFEN